MMPITEIDKYLIKKHLGNGQFGNVYSAYDRALDQDKAIKVIDVPDPNEFLKNIEEAQILNKCKHKHIVRINEANIFKVNGAVIVVIDMENIKGGSLEKQMEKRHISSVEARRIFIDILFGLEYSHSQNILHRDIKPANIMLDKTCAKLSDFGLATFLGMSSYGSPKGYITHLAPETIMSDITSIQTDIYSVGITLFRVVCNKKEWRNIIKDISNVRDKIVSGSLLSSIGYEPYVPQKLKRIINKAVNIDTAKRYQHARELREALESLKPKINWIQKDMLNWNGVSISDQTKHFLTLTLGKQFYVEYKKNNRRVKSMCSSFKNILDAQKYLHTIIAKSLFY